MPQRTVAGAVSTVCDETQREPDGLSHEEKKSDQCVEGHLQ